MNPVLTKSYTAGATVNPCRFIKNGSGDNIAIQATSAAAAILGISVENIIAAAGAQVDAVKLGLAYLELGGTVTRGQHLIPDSVGRGIAATVEAGTEQHTGAVAEVSGVLGDIIPVFVNAGNVIATDTGIIEETITITTGQLLALNATPKELVAAPGAGMAVIIEGAQRMHLDYNSAAYAGIAAGEDLEMRYTDGSGQLIATIESTGFLDATADAFRAVYPVTTSAITPVANAAVVMRLASGEIITGDSPLKVRVRYRIVALAL